jgi:hypothetical protein
MKRAWQADTSQLWLGWKKRRRVSEESAPLPAGSSCSWMRPTHGPAAAAAAAAATAAAADDDDTEEDGGAAAATARWSLIAPIATFMYHMRPLDVSSTCRQPVPDENVTNNHCGKERGRYRSSRRWGGRRSETPPPRARAAACRHPLGAAAAAAAAPCSPTSPELSPAAHAQHPRCLRTRTRRDAAAAAHTASASQQQMMMYRAAEPPPPPLLLLPPPPSPLPTLARCRSARCAAARSRQATPEGGMRRGDTWRNVKQGSWGCDV